MKVDDDDLRYGFVLTRLPRDNEWWHGWLVRSNLSYACGLLGRRTTMLLIVQRLGIGGALRSKEFFLTLDGEGIDEGTGLRSTGDWGETEGTAFQRADAMRVRQTVVPLLHVDQRFQQAVWFIIKHSEYETVANLDVMRRLDVPPFESE